TSCWARSNVVEEREWLTSTDPQTMLSFLQGTGKASPQKFRLFAVACCRHLLQEVRVDPKDLHAVEVAERHADGVATATELAAAATYVYGPPSARRTAASACRDAASPEAGAEMADCTAENAAWAAGEHAALLWSPELAAARATERSAQAA